MAELKKGKGWYKQNPKMQEGWRPSTIMLDQTELIITSNQTQTKLLAFVGSTSNYLSKEFKVC